MSPILKFRWISFYIMLYAFGGLLLFLYGFFPLKYHGGPEANWSDLPTEVNGISVDGKQLYLRNKTRVVMMVIDALRYDFVSAKYMPVTSELIKNENACLYKAQAQPPTVTMPRIKAMTTGSVSNFIDVALNFGSSAVMEDSFLNQAKKNNKTMVFFGDDTWIRLFPDIFARSEGTTSFFVSDYTEVDLNVTRHLDAELSDLAEGPDWDLMVLHYLGLDHIGHLEGPASPKVGPKMAEMDAVVSRIVEAAKIWKGDTVLMICGDHGMKDSGSHGGASYSEVTVPLVITQKNGCYNKHPSNIDQVDIAPTMSYLLGLPIPSASTGQILPQVLGDGKNGDLSSKRSLYALHYNAKVNVAALMSTLGVKEASSKDCYSHYKTAVLHHHNTYAKEGVSSKYAATMYLTALNNMAKYLNESVVEFDMFAIVLGIIILIQCLIAQFFVMLLSFQPKHLKEFSSCDGFKLSSTKLKRIFVLAVVLVICAGVYMISCGVTQTNSSLCKPYPISLITVAYVLVILISNTIVIMFALKDINSHNELTYLNPIELFLVVATVVHALTYGGTSFIEEEHQTWYYFWVTAEFIVLIYTCSILVDYVRKKGENATETQEKANLERKMSVAGNWLLPQWVLMMGLHRFLRTLNQTGDKWAFLPDTGDWMNEEENKNILSPLAIFAISCIGLMCLKNLHEANNLHWTNIFLTIGATLCIFSYRVTTLTIHVPFDFPAMNEVWIVRIFWIIIFAMMVTDIWHSANYLYKKTGTSTNRSRRINENPDASNGIYIQENRSVIQRHVTNEFDSSLTSRLLPMSEGSTESVEPCLKMHILSRRTNTFLNIMILVCSLLLRPHNLILVPSVYLTSKVINNILDYKLGTVTFSIDSTKHDTESKNLFCKTIFHLWIGAVFYFYQGNSNSLASIDLGSGYIGLESYIPVVVALQMGVHTYTGPLLAGLLLFVDCVKTNDQYEKFRMRLSECVATISVLRIYPLVVYTIITAFLRYHLFVWTVFSPKLLYDFTYMYFSLSSILTMILMCKSIQWQEKFNSFLRSRNDQPLDNGYEPKDL